MNLFFFEKMIKIDDIFHAITRYSKDKLKDKTEINDIIEKVNHDIEFVEHGYLTSCFLNLTDLMDLFASKLQEPDELIMENAMYYSLNNKESLIKHTNLFYKGNPLTTRIADKLSRSSLEIFKCYSKYYNYDPVIIVYVCLNENIELLEYLICNNLFIMTYGFYGICKSNDNVLALLILGLNYNLLEEFLIIISRCGSVSNFKIMLKLSGKQKLDFYYIISTIMNPEVRDYIRSIHNVDLLNGRRLAYEDGRNFYINQANKLFEDTT